jgi:hypothetical protein
MAPGLLNAKIRSIDRTYVATDTGGSVLVTGNISDNIDGQETGWVGRVRLRRQTVLLVPRITEGLNEHTDQSI